MKHKINYIHKFFGYMSWLVKYHGSCQGFSSCRGFNHTLIPMMIIHQLCIKKMIRNPRIKNEAMIYKSEFHLGFSVKTELPHVVQLWMASFRTQLIICTCYSVHESDSSSIPHRESYAKASRALATYNCNFIVVNTYMFIHGRCLKPQCHEASSSNDPHESRQIL